MPVRRRHRILPAGSCPGTWSVTGGVTPSPLIALAAAPSPSPGAPGWSRADPATGQPVLVPKSVLEWSAEATKGPPCRHPGKVCSPPMPHRPGTYGTMSLSA